MKNNMLKIAAILAYVWTAFYLISIIAIAVAGITIYNDDRTAWIIFEGEEDLRYIMTGLAISAAFIILPLTIFTFIGGKKFSNYANLSDEELILKRGSIIAWSIFFILTNLFSGIFGFIALSSFSSNSSNVTSSLESKLKELQRLYDNGLISSEEYHQRRKIIIEKVY